MSQLMVRPGAVAPVWLVLAAAGTLAAGGFPPIAAGGATSIAARAQAGADEACDAAAKPAKLNYSLKNLDGASVKLSDLKGKVIVLNFWATWCVPCKTEIPILVDVQARYEAQGVQLLGASVGDSLATLTKYVSQARMNYPVLQVRENDAIVDAYAISTLPTTIVIRRDGRVCRTHVGAIVKDVLEREIKSLL
jgi:thiol-disulfide isomerase/thioredoxin